MKLLLCASILVFALLACSLGTSPQTNLQSNTDTPFSSQVSSTLPMATSEQTETPVPNTAAPSNTPGPSDTPAPTFPPELTLTPGIMETATAYSASVTADFVHNLALMGPMADLLQISQYFNPVGTPLKSWHDIPIMFQATDGQEFKSDIYSYKAAATLTQATSYYNGKSTSLHWSCTVATGHAGTGSNADHSTTFVCSGFIIDVTSFDNDTKHVIVVIEKAS
jgi:hypothetical protein